MIRYWRSPSILILLYTACFATLAVWMPFRPNLYESKGWDEFADTRPEVLFYIFLLVLMFGLYVGLVRLTQTKQWQPNLWALIGITTLLILPTLFTYPYNANDLYRYAIRGNITAVYGGNPFVDPPQSYPSDPLLPMAGEWRSFTTPYGPVWEGIAAIPAASLADSPLHHLIALKAIAALAHLATLIAIWVGGSAAHRATTAALWGLNPGLLLIFGVDGHNDSWMIFWLVLGWLSVHRGMVRREMFWQILGFWLLWLSPLTKAIGLLPIPFIAFAAFWHWPTWRQRGTLVVGTLAGWAFITWAAFAPFGDPIALLQRLVTEVTNASSFAIVTLALLLQQEAGSLTIDLFERLFVGGMVCLGLWLAWRTWLGRSPLRAAADIFIGYILLAFSFRLWYAAWSFPFTLLDEEGPTWRIEAGIWFLLFAQLNVVVYGPFRSWVDSPLVAHQVGIPITFVLPALLPLIGPLLHRHRTNHSIEV